MPWGAPIGSGRGLNNPFGLTALRAHFPDVPLIIDAGIGVPSHAARALELGFDAVLINTAVAQDRKSTRLNSSHLVISYAVFCLKKKKTMSLFVRRVSA